MTRKDRSNLQQRLLLRHYSKFLEPSEAQEYRNKLMKSSYTLLGALLMIPINAFHIIKLNRNKSGKSRPLVNGLLIQLFFSILNYRYAKQYHDLDLEM